MLTVPILQANVDVVHFGGAVRTEEPFMPNLQLDLTGKYTVKRDPRSASAPFYAEAVQALIEEYP